MTSRQELERAIAYKILRTSVADNRVKAIMFAVDKFTAGVIGEDDPDFPENKDRGWTYPKVRSRLRAEQRKRAGLEGES